mmetsp:Transcript_58627/g.143367  ORF Transcript_58627/g.143367 Transcript_58627/m.143367 type:complete len:127 (+) Transcript_58627:338-718(+)
MEWIDAWFSLSLFFFLFFTHNNCIVSFAWLLTKIPIFQLFPVPFMWIFKLYGGCLPFVDDDMVDVAVLVSSAVYAYATSQYISGYIESPSKRMFGFKVRRRVCEFWLFGSVGAIVWAAAQRFGIVS